MPIGHYKVSKLFLKTSHLCGVFYVIYVLLASVKHKNRLGATNTKAM
nr:MAG TPA: hypothetical protein [Caudoviricetes sp.]